MQQKFSSVEKLTKRLTLKKIINWWKCPPYTKAKAVEIIDDGNCLLHAVSFALYGSQDTELKLRESLHIYLSNNDCSDRLSQIYRQTLSNSEIPILQSEEQWQEEWNEIVENTTPEAINGKYKWLEPIHIFTLANYLKIPIVVLANEWLYDLNGEAVDRIQMGGIYLPLLSEPNDCRKEPIYIVYDLAHFSALEGPLNIPIDQLEVKFATTNDNIVQKYMAVEKNLPLESYQDAIQSDEFQQANICGAFEDEVDIEPSEKNFEPLNVNEHAAECKANDRESKVCLSQIDCDLNVQIHGDSVTPITEGILAFAWGGVRASHGVEHSKVFFEVKIGNILFIPNLNMVEQLHQIRIGWSTSHSDLQLGENQSSVGFCSCGNFVYSNTYRKFGQAFGVGDVIGAYLDMSSDLCTVYFSINGKMIMEKAFEFTSIGALYPHISSKNVKYEVNFGEKEFFPSKLNEFSEYKLIGHSTNLIEGRRATNKPAKVIILVGSPEGEKCEWATTYEYKNTDKVIDRIHILSRGVLLEKMKVKLLD